MLTYTVLPGPSAISRALAALPPYDGVPLCLELAPGEYREKLVLDRPHLVLRGAGADKTVIRWQDGAKEPMADGQPRGTFRTATVRVDAPAGAEHLERLRPQGAGRSGHRPVCRRGFLPLRGLPPALLPGHAVHRAPAPEGVAEKRLHRPQAVRAPHAPAPHLPPLPHRGGCRLHLRQRRGMV